MGQFPNAQIRRIAPIEDGLHDVRGKKSAAQNSAKVLLIEA